MKLKRRPRAIIYDLDGVLLDTEHFYTEVTQEIVERYGKRFDWSLKQHMIGRPAIESARFLVEQLALPISPEEYLAIRRARLRERFRTAQEKPGARAFTQALAARGVPQAVATSSEGDLFEAKLSRHKDWFACFRVIVCGDDPALERGKPAPDIFLLAAERLGEEPGSCLVFEDAPAGVAAARAASMQVVAMPDPQMDVRRFHDADLVIADFRELRPEDLGL